MPSEINVPDEALVSQIYLLRGQKVMIDRDLAKLYGVETKRLKEAVKRNLARFPPDFMFEMTQEEFKNWRSQNATSNSEKMGLRYAPFCFTEQGVTMLSCILCSERAIAVNIPIVRKMTQPKPLPLARAQSRAGSVEVIHLKNSTMRNGYYVYILECADGTYYVGMTNNMDRRFVEHEEGLNEDAYTYSRRPLKLAWAEKYLSVRLAYQVERKLKKWSAKKKKALIEGRFDDLKELAKCKNETTHERLKENDPKRKKPSGGGPQLRKRGEGNEKNDPA